MKKQILALLEEKFQGERKDGLNLLAGSIALQATTEEEANTIVGKLTAESVKSFISDMRKDVDSEIERANQTRETNLRKKFDFVEKGNPEPGGGGSDPKGGGDPNDIAAKLDAMLEKRLAPLQEKLDKYEKGDIAKTRLQSLNDKLSGCKDDNFKAQTLKDFERMQFDTDEAFNEYLTEKETAITTANQNVANAALGGQSKPLFTAKDEATGVSKGVAEFVESQKPDNKTFSGKEV